jgi:2-iminobutanoate/2-iminopropanoate deaminase
MSWETKRCPMYYGDAKQIYPNIMPSEPALSKAIVVGNLVFISGMHGRNLKTGKVESDEFEEQMITALNNIRAAMEEAGSSMNNIIKTTIYLKHLENYARMRKTELKYYQEHAPYLVENPPASTFAQVNLIGKPEYLVMIEAIGVVSRDKPDWEVEMIPMYYQGVKQIYPNVAPGSPIFSQSAKVGNLIFCSGSAGRSIETKQVDSDKLEEQMIVASDKIRTAMEKAGSSMNNIIKTFHWLPNQKDLWEVWGNELKYYNEHAPSLIDEPPASTLAVVQLADPKYKIETEVIGVVDRKRRGWEVTTQQLYYFDRGWPKHIGAWRKQFSRSVRVGNLLFISGMEGGNPFTGTVDTTDVVEQTNIVMNKLKVAMEEVGSTMDNLIKLVMLVPRAEDYPAIRKTEFEFYQKHAPGLVENPPSLVTFQAPLAHDTYTLEIDALGLIPK